MAARPTTTPRPSPSASLEYSPPPPRHRRWMRRAPLPVLAILVLGSAVWWGPAAWYRVRLRHYERQCARYVAPPDAVAYSEHPGDADRLLAAKQGYQTLPGGLPDTFLVPDAWSKFYGLLSPPGFRSHGTAFLGERRTSGGKRLLVAVDFLDQPTHETGRSGVQSVRFQVRAFQPGGLFTLPVEIQSEPQTLVLYTWDVGPAPLRLRAGQPDPADPTHFTIPWELAGDAKLTGVIDGWLRDTGVDLEQR